MVASRGRPRHWLEREIRVDRKDHRCSMTTMRHVGFALAATLVTGSVIACVGDDPPPAFAQPDPGVPVGHYKGACTTEKTCLEGLVCTQGAVCLYPGDAAPPSDGSVPPRDDRGVGCPFSSATLDVTISCGAATCTDTCCFDQQGTTACSGACPTLAPRRSMGCDSKYQCATGECCLAVTAPIDTSKCPSPLAFVDVVESACVPDGCDVSPGSNQHKMCRTDSECAAPALCREIEISTGVSKFAYGICN